MHPSLSGTCINFDFNGESVMKKIALLGGNLLSLSMAHSILDYTDSVEIHIIEEKAEIGLMGEYPGIIKQWPIFPKHWISNLFSQNPSELDTAVRHSWLLKAIAIQLSKRNAVFHLRTKIIEIIDNELKLSGAGYMGKTSILFDSVFDNVPDKKNQQLWNGGICLTTQAPEYGIQGKRNDGTIEIWWKNDEYKIPNYQWVHKMTWHGTNPENLIENHFRMGVKLARDYIDTIIHQ